jgi:hypothetical protein
MTLPPELEQKKTAGTRGPAAAGILLRADRVQITSDTFTTGQQIRLARFRVVRQVVLVMSAANFNAPRPGTSTTNPSLPSSGDSTSSQAPVACGRAQASSLPDL